MFNKSLLQMIEVQRQLQAGKTVVVVDLTDGGSVIHRPGCAPEVLDAPSSAGSDLDRSNLEAFRFSRLNRLNELWGKP